VGSIGNHQTCAQFLSTSWSFSLAFPPSLWASWLSGLTPPVQAVIANTHHTLCPYVRPETLARLNALTGRLNYISHWTHPYFFLCRFSLSPVHPICVCPKPYTVCNGRCGYYSGCPSSGYYKRAVTGNKKLQCDRGMTACPIIGRENSWECVDTMNDLESCEYCQSLHLVYFELD